MVKFSRNILFGISCVCFATRGVAQERTRLHDYEIVDVQDAEVCECADCTAPPMDATTNVTLNSTAEVDSLPGGHLRGLLSIDQEREGDTKEDEQVGIDLSGLDLNSALLFPDEVDLSSRKPRKTLVASKKKKGTKSTPLPPGGVCIEGNCQWLYYCDQNPGWWCMTGCLVIVVDCALPGATEQKIADACEGKPTLLEKIQCMSDMVNKELKALDAKDGDKDYVCRHYAQCMMDVAGRMDPPLNADGEAGNKHAWVSFHTAGPPPGTYHVDAYNQITFFIPD